MGSAAFIYKTDSFYQKSGFILYQIVAFNNGTTDYVGFGTINNSSRNILGVEAGVAVGWHSIEFRYDGYARLDGGAWEAVIDATDKYLLWHCDANGDITLDNVYVYTAGDSTTSTVAVSASANTGANYDAITNGIWGSITNAGTTPKCKINFTQAADEAIILKGLGMIWR